MTSNGTLAEAASGFIVNLQDDRVIEINFKHKSEEIVSGFSVKLQDNQFFEVTFQPKRIKVEYSSDGRITCRKYGLCEFSRVLDCLFANLNMSRRPPFYDEESLEYETTDLIEEELISRWKPYLEQVNPKVRAVQQAIFDAANLHATIAEADALYEDPSLVKDIINCRAATLAACYIGTLFLENPYKTVFYNGETEFNNHPNACFEWERVDDYISKLQNWRGLYSSDGKPYGALNRALMNLPEHIPFSLLKNMAKVRLERPNYTELELEFILQFAGDWKHKRKQDFEQLIMNSTEDEIYKALKLIQNANGPSLYTGSPYRFHDFFRYLFSTPIEDAPDTLVGMAKKAIFWHMECRGQLSIWALKVKGENTKAARPPIPLPADERITFLQDVREIVDEGDTMDYCFKRYAQDAVDGDYYLFHADYEGEQATICVDSNGSVLKAAGPKIEKNEASSWAEEVLTAWGDRFPEKREKTIYEKHVTPKFD